MHSTSSANDPSTEHVVDIPLSWQLLHAATLIIAPPVNPGQLHKHLDNLGQSWQSILSRCSDSIKFAANQLKEIPSSWADRPAEPVSNLLQSDQGS
ncbi:hypothetical protein MJO28_013599 [Puccinia striiformis f. sp. tritici]|uniref:Uncharacterized protein n=1 Tax=Puccinia striiformis f. sp. tritici TaxID=168172 RepID=A0ACC0DUY6_9BASI|nr:hypothetical protein MJO28_013599 [Puccinia striiformis f. sp. tritici]